jgi:hypothetical protein
MRSILQRRAFFGLALASLLACVEVALEPWHVYTDHHHETIDLAGHSSTREFHSHSDEHGEDRHDEHSGDHDGQHEHHPVVDHEQSSHPGRDRTPVVVTIVVLIAVLDVAVPDQVQVAGDTPTLPANESPPDRRLSQRGPPRA